MLKIDFIVGIHGIILNNGMLLGPFWVALVFSAHANRGTSTRRLPTPCETVRHDLLTVQYTTGDRSGSTQTIHTALAHDEDVKRAAMEVAPHNLGAPIVDHASQRVGDAITPETLDESELRDEIQDRAGENSRPGAANDVRLAQ